MGSVQCCGFVEEQVVEDVFIRPERLEARRSTLYGPPAQQRMDVLEEQVVHVPKVIQQERAHHFHVEAGSREASEAGPQAQERPVASPQHRNRAERKIGLPSKALEPQKVMLPGAVDSPPGLGATAAAALAAMRALGSPGLEEAGEESAGMDATPVINADASPESRLAVSPTVAGRESDAEASQVEVPVPTSEDRVVVQRPAPGTRPAANIQESRQREEGEARSDQKLADLAAACREVAEAAEVLQKPSQSQVADEREQLLTKQGGRRQHCSVEERERALQELSARWQKLEEAWRKIDVCKKREGEWRGDAQKTSAEAEVAASGRADPTIKGKLGESGKEARNLGRRLDKHAEDRPVDTHHARPPSKGKWLLAGLRGREYQHPLRSVPASPRSLTSGFRPPQRISGRGNGLEMGRQSSCRCVEAGSTFRAQSAEVQLRAEVEELFREVLASVVVTLVFAILAGNQS
ncbi:smc3 [Symbiodinium sp. CCMP2592]|nr:smc3 [Symbiodinium sp. CCMP2592]